MAVQILNQMPDAKVHRGDPAVELRVVRQQSHEPRGIRISGRAGFMAATIALHVILALGFLNMQSGVQAKPEPEPIVASLIEAPSAPDETPPQYSPPPPELVYSLPMTQELSFETESITPPPVLESAITPAATSVVPPMVDSVEYLRAPPPVYPKESQRKREHGTVVLRVLVDALGHPAQIQVERSSGHERLDTAARDAVAKFLFRPYVVGGVAQPAQVLIPIGFEPRSS